MARVTAVILCYKRENNIAKIVDSLVKYPFIDEILIRKSSEYERSNPLNKGCYMRYELAKQSRNEIIYTQDDDSIVHDVDKIFAQFSGDGIVSGANESLLNAWEKEYKPNRMTLVGWGGFFGKRWIKVFDKYISKYGEDDVLYREADRIFSILTGKEHKLIPVTIEQLNGADTGLCSHGEEYLTARKLSIQRALELWRQ